MDPFSAIGLASSIIQCVQFVGKIISQSREIQKDAYGLPAELVSINEVSKHLASISQELDSQFSRSSLLKLSSSEKTLRDLCKESRAINDEVSQLLDRLQIKGQPTTSWTGIKYALRSTWSVNEIKNLEGKLDRIRKRVDTTVLICLREELNAEAKNGLVPYRYNTELGNQLKEHHEELLNAIKKNSWRESNRQHMLDFSSQLSLGVRLNTEGQFRSIILSHLEFNDMRDRHGGIYDAHQETFRWVYHRSTSDKPLQWDDFPAWLDGSSDGNLYWITGKVGSGKSTLMKYIYDNPDTYRLLKNWAGALPLLSAGFFFWSSGTAMQMSRMGLLQSLLHQILSRHQTLITQIFCKRWEAYSAIGSGTHNWTWPELKEAFEILISNKTLRFSFFLDGLDEFEGDHRELVEFILSASDRENVKVCSASRPWLVFEDAFGSKPNFFLEKITENDIRNYTLDKFMQNKRYQLLNEREPKYATGLVESVVEKSSGVFLWVCLVVKSLLEGLTNSDRVSDLQKRLDSLPIDLETLFQRLLGGLDSFYFQQACQMLSIITVAQEPPDVLVFSFAEEDDAAGLSTSTVENLSNEQLCDIIENTRRRLSSRCRGLLELTTLDGKPNKVMFYHRTVKDFITQSSVFSQLISASNKDFNPHLRLMSGYIQEIKLEGSRQSITPESFLKIFTSLAWALEYALQSEWSTGEVPLQHLNALGEVIHLHYGREGPFWNTMMTRVDGLHSWEMLLLSCGHRAYLRTTLDSRSPNYKECSQEQRTMILNQLTFIRSSLPRLLSHYHAISSKRPDTHEHILRLLLDQGANPKLILADKSKFSELPENIQNVYQPYIKGSIGNSRLFRRLRRRKTLQ